MRDNKKSRQTLENTAESYFPSRLRVAPDVEATDISWSIIGQSLVQINFRCAFINDPQINGRTEKIRIYSITKNNIEIKFLV